MKTEKEKLIELIEALNEKQTEYLYNLVSMLFCQTTD